MHESLRTLTQVRQNLFGTRSIISTIIHFTILEFGYNNMKIIIIIFILGTEHLSPWNPSLHVHILFSMHTPSTQGGSHVTTQE